MLESYVSSVSQKPASMSNSQISGLLNLCSLDGLYRGGPGPRPSFHWSPTMPLCWPLYICWSAPNTKASRHPILLAWFKEEKKALLLPWVIPGQASQEHPVGGLCSKGASCSQLEVPQPLQAYIVHLPRPKYATIQPPFQEVDQGLRTEMVVSRN